MSPRPRQMPKDAVIPPMTVTVSRNLFGRAANKLSVAYKARVRFEGMQGHLDFKFDVQRAFIAAQPEGQLMTALTAHVRALAAQNWWERFGRWKEEAIQ